MTGGTDEATRGVIELPFRDFYSEEPVGDEAFEAILAQYAYDRVPLEAEIEEELDEGAWIRQRVAFDAGYGERMFAFLYLPKRGRPPFQTVVHFPGSGVIHRRSSEDLDPSRIEFFLNRLPDSCSPAQRSVHATAKKAISCYETRQLVWLIWFSFLRA